MDLYSTENLFISSSSIYSEFLTSSICNLLKSSLYSVNHYQITFNQEREDGGDASTGDPNDNANICSSCLADIREQESLEIR